MKKAALVLALAGSAWLVLPGCRSRAPSPDYQEAMARHAKLYGELLDKAYLDPRMAEVETLLNKVPANSIDRPAADALLRDIAARRAVAQNEAAKRQAAIAEALKPPPGFERRAPSSGARLEPAAPEAPDAGATQPVPGMPLAEFQSRFSRCFESGASVEVTGRGRMQTFQLKNIANCRDLHPQAVGQLLLVGDGRIFSQVPAAAVQVTWRYPDGGVADAGP